MSTSGFRLEFAVLEDGKVKEGWRLATVEECKTNKEKLKEVLSAPECNWYICRLQDGKIHGPARMNMIEDGIAEDEKFGHMIVCRPYNLQLCINDPSKCPTGWKLATCSEVKGSLAEVQDLVGDSTAEYKMQDGRLNTNNGTCTVEEGGCWFGWFHRQEKTIITRDPALNSPYKVVPNGTPPEGWRLIKCQEAEDNLEHVKAVLGPDKPAYVCAASDGLVHGTDGKHKIQAGEHDYTLSYMIITKIPEFKIEEFGDVGEGWHMATVKEVTTDLDSLKKCFKAGMEWHICQLLDGTIKGPGYEYITTEGQCKEKLGHMVLIKDDI